jgi:hypothetical protein
VAFNALSKKGTPPELFAGIYGQEPPVVRGRDVYIVDFSYKLETMRALIAEAKSLVVLDHHKTAQEVLGDQYSFDPLLKARITFDMNRSGAGITWDYFYPGEPRPWLVDYVEDRDIWKWKLRDSRAVNAFIASLPYELEAWENTDLDYTVDTAVPIGLALLRKADSYNAALIEVLLMRRNLGQYPQVPIINAPTEGVSELMEEMLKLPGAPFVLCWRLRKDRAVSVSLRSVGEFDVSQLAKQYGGGGHKNAAGFELKGKEAVDFLSNLIEEDQ